MSNMPHGQEQTLRMRSVNVQSSVQIYERSVLQGLAKQRCALHTPMLTVIEDPRSLFFEKAQLMPTAGLITNRPISNTLLARASFSFSLQDESYQTLTCTAVLSVPDVIKGNISSERAADNTFKGHLETSA